MSLDLCLLFPPGYGFDEINTQPIITVPGAQSVDSHETLTFEGATLISIADAEDHEQTVTLAVSHGTLTLSQTTGLSFDAGDGTADATMTFTGSLTNVNAALDGLIYDPTNSYGGADTLTVDSTDALGVAAVQKTVAITVDNSLLTDLISWWKLDESSGTRADAHASNDLTDGGTTGDGDSDGVYAPSGFGANQSVAKFVAASSNNLLVSDSPDLSVGTEDFTCVIWVRVANYSADKDVIGHMGASGQYSWLLTSLGGEWRCYWSVDGSSLSYVSVAHGDVDTWQMLCVRRNATSGGLSLSVNNGTPDTDTFAGGHDSTGNVQIGVVPSGRYFDGYISNAVLWNRELTDGEVTGLYNSGNGVPYPGA